MMYTPPPPPTTYPRLPELAPRRDDETAQAYGLRAFAFVLAHDVTATVPDDALALATHVYRLTIARSDLLPGTLDQLAETDREINAALRRRSIDAPPPLIDLGQLAVDDKPAAGPMAPLTPAPKTQPPAPMQAAPPPPPVTSSRPARTDFAF